MNAKELFRTVYDAEAEMLLIRERQQKYRDIGTSMGGSSTSTIRATEKRSRVEMAAVEIVSLAEDLAPELERYAALVRLAEKVLNTMQGVRHKEVLTRRYILHEEWEDIGVVMGYTGDKSVYNLHGWALLRAQKALDKLPNEYKIVPNMD